MTYTPRTETLTGADLTGTSGTANRTYELDNDNAINSMMRVFRAEAALQNGTNFTFDTDTNTITFITKVWDNQPILLYYLTSPSGNEYTSTLDICRICGIGVDKFSETLGTGDNSTDSYDLDNPHVIYESYSLEYGESGSNSLLTLQDGEDYSIDLDKGLILLTAAGITKVNGKVIYANYLYLPKMSNTILTTYILPASKEVGNDTGNYWGTEKTSTQYFDGFESGFPSTNQPFGNDTNDYDYPEFELDNKGITGITSVKFVDFTGTTTTTLTSTEYKYDEDGRVIVNKTIPNGKRNIEIIYTHGYDEVPTDVSQLAALTAGIMALVFISGGSYDDVTGYTIGRKSFQIGEAWVNIREVLSQLDKRVQKTLKKVGEGYACC